MLSKALQLFVRTSVKNLSSNNSAHQLAAFIGLGLTATHLQAGTGKEFDVKGFVNKQLMFLSEEEKSSVTNSLAKAIQSVDGKDTLTVEEAASLKQIIQQAAADAGLSEAQFQQILASGDGSFLIDKLATRAKPASPTDQTDQMAERTYASEAELAKPVADAPATPAGKQVAAVGAEMAVDAQTGSMSTLLGIVGGGLAIAAAASSGGGSGGGSGGRTVAVTPDQPSQTTTPQSLSFQVFDPPISSGTVKLVTANGQTFEGALQPNGSVTIAVPQGVNLAGATATFVPATGTTDVLGNAFGLEMKALLAGASAGALAISPLTTVLALGTLSEAELVGALGLPAGTTISTLNPFADGFSGSDLLSATKVAALTTAVGNLLEAAASLGDATATQQMSNSIASAFKGFVAANAPVDISDVIGQVIDAVLANPAVGSALQAKIAAVKADVVSNTDALEAVFAKVAAGQVSFAQLLQPNSELDGLEENIANLIKTTITDNLPQPTPTEAPVVQPPAQGGGGGGGSVVTPVAKIAKTLSVVDGPLAFADVYYDSNANGIADKPSEFLATTDQNGNATFEYTPVAGGKFIVLPTENTKDVLTGNRFTTTLEVSDNGQPGEQVASPLSSLLDNPYLEETKLKQLLNISADTDLATFNFFKALKGGEGVTPEQLQTAQKLSAAAVAFGNVVESIISIAEANQGFLTADQTIELEGLAFDVAGLTLSKLIEPTVVNGVVSPSLADVTKIATKLATLVVVDPNFIIDDLINYLDENFPDGGLDPKVELPPISGVDADVLASADELADSVSQTSQKLEELFDDVGEDGGKSLDEVSGSGGELDKLEDASDDQTNTVANKSVGISLVKDTYSLKENDSTVIKGSVFSNDSLPKDTGIKSINGTAMTTVDFESTDPSALTGQVYRLSTQDYKVAQPTVSKALLNQFLSTATPGIDAAGEFGTAGSAIVKEFTVKAGDTISFDYTFGSFDYVPYIDFAFVSIQKQSGAGSDVGVNHLFDVEDLKGPQPYNLAGQFTEKDGKYSYTFSEEGTYQVGIGLIDARDQIVDSVLTVSNIGITSDGIFDQLAKGTLDGFNVAGNVTTNPDGPLPPQKAILATGFYGTLVINEAGEFGYLVGGDNADDIPVDKVVTDDFTYSVEVLQDGVVKLATQKISFVITGTEGGPLVGIKADDHSDFINGATKLEDGVAKDGTLELNGDRDVFELDLVKGQRYDLSFKVNGGPANFFDDEAYDNAYVQFLNENGVGINVNEFFVNAFDDNFNDAPRSTKFVSAITGKVYARVQSNSEDAPIDYSLSFTAIDIEDDHPDLSDDPTIETLLPGTPINGKIDIDNDKDLFKFEAKAGQSYNFTLQNTDDTDSFDVVNFRVLQQSTQFDGTKFLNTIAFGSSATDGNASQFQLRFEQDQTIYLLAETNFETDGFSQYTVSVEEVDTLLLDDDHGNSTDDTATILALSSTANPQEPITGEIDNTTQFDSDVFKLSPSADKEVTFVINNTTANANDQTGDIFVEILDQRFNSSGSGFTNPLFGQAVAAGNQLKLTLPAIDGGLNDQTANYFVRVTGFGSSVTATYDIAAIDANEADDYADVVANSTELIMDAEGPVQGLLETTTDVDVFHFSVQQGERYQFTFENLPEEGEQSQNSTFDLILAELREQFDNFYGFNGSKSVSDNTKGVFTFFANQDVDFAVRIKGSDGSFKVANNPYQVKVQKIAPTDDHTDFLASDLAQDLTVGESITGVLDFNGDKDVFDFNATKGQNYIFDFKFTGESVPSGEDFFAQIYKETASGITFIGNSVISRSNVDQFGQAYAQLNFQADQDAKYYVQMESLKNDPIPYEISVLEVDSDEHGGDIGIATPLDLSDGPVVIESSLELLGDRDFFSISLPEGAEGKAYYDVALEYVPQEGETFGSIDLFGYYEYSNGFSFNPYFGNSFINQFDFQTQTASVQTVNVRVLAEQADNLFLGVAGFANKPNKTYKLTVNEDDHGDFFDNATVVNLATNVDGVLSTGKNVSAFNNIGSVNNSDRDTFKFTVEANKKYLLQLTNKSSLEAGRDISTQIVEQLQNSIDFRGFVFTEGDEVDTFSFIAETANDFFIQLYSFSNDGVPFAYSLRIDEVVFDENSGTNGVLTEITEAQAAAALTDPNFDPASSTKLIVEGGSLGNLSLIHLTALDIDAFAPVSFDLIAGEGSTLGDLADVVASPNVPDFSQGINTLGLDALGVGELAANAELVEALHDIGLDQFALSTDGEVQINEADISTLIALRDGKSKLVSFADSFKRDDASVKATAATIQAETGTEDGYTLKDLGDFGVDLVKFGDIAPADVQFTIGSGYNLNVVADAQEAAIEKLLAGFGGAVFDQAAKVIMQVNTSTINLSDNAKAGLVGLGIDELLLSDGQSLVLMGEAPTQNQVDDPTVVA